MSRVVAYIFLSLSPLIITVAVGIVGFGIHAIGRGFGSTRSHAPIAIAAIIVWLLHAGFLLGPWLYAHERRTLAAWLMLPVAVLGTIACILAAKQLLPSHPDDYTPATVICSIAWTLAAKQLLPSHPDDYTPATVICSIAWTLAVILGYIAPIIVMLIQPRLVPATH